MKIEYDSEKSESVLHLNVEEMGFILFALSFAAVAASSPLSRKRLREMHDQLTGKSSDGI
jgi:hypothetical protein